MLKVTQYDFPNTDMFSEMYRKIQNVDAMVLVSPSAPTPGPALKQSAINIESDLAWRMYAKQN